MKPLISLAAALLLLAGAAPAPARAAEPPQDDSGTKNRAELAREKLAREKMERLRESRKSAARPATPKQKEASADRHAAMRAKSTFIYAVEACDQPSHCDKSLRDDAEKAFMDACNICAPADRCDAERDAIRAGTSKRTDNPCAAR